MKQEILNILEKYSQSFYNCDMIIDDNFEQVADEIIVLMEAEITRKHFDNTTVSKMEITQQANTRTAE